MVVLQVGETLARLQGSIPTMGFSTLIAGSLSTMARLWMLIAGAAALADVPLPTAPQLA